MSQNKKKLIPELRFPEFKNEGEWEINEVGDVFEVTRGYVLSMNLVSEEQNESNPYPVYSSQTKNNGLAGYYKDFLYEDAITWTTDGANAGDVNFRKGKFYCTNVFGVLINKNGFSNPCIAELINSVSKKHVSYVGNPKLMNGVMSKIKIPFPSIPEQQKIAACLSSLDELIKAESQKLEALKEHKKGLMQNLFPQEGETVPKLRFPEFMNEGEWSCEKIENIFDLQEGYAFSSNAFTNSKEDSKQVIRITDINNQNKNADKVYVSEDTFKELELDKYKVKKGDLLLSLTGAAGFNFFIWNSEEAYINQRTMKLNPKKKGK